MNLMFALDYLDNIANMDDFYSFDLDYIISDTHDYFETWLKSFGRSNIVYTLFSVLKRWDDISARLGILDKPITTMIILLV